MVFLVLLALSAVLVLSYRNDPEGWHHFLKDVLGIEGYGLRAATLIALPLAAIAYVLMWTTKTNTGGMAVAIPLLVAAVPFALPLVALLTGNGDRFRASWALKVFYVAVAGALVVNFLSGFALVTFTGTPNTGSHMQASYLGIALAIIGIVGTILMDKRKKGTSKADRANSDRIRTEVGARLERIRQLTPSDGENFVSPNAPLPHIDLSGQELRVPKF